MSHQKQIFSILALVAPVVVAVVAISSTTNSAAVADTRTADLCISTGIDTRPDDDNIGRGACVYASADAPVLEADVCWDGRVAKLKGTAPCSGYARAYRVRHGEVLDPTSGEIAAYAPLTDTCKIVPCGPNYEEQPVDDGTACCDPQTGDCTSPDANGMCTVGDITWCKELETHPDGSVTCFE